MAELPTSYTAIEHALDQANVVKAMLGLKPVTKKLRNPEPDELLLKMEAASINPSDIAFLQGNYQIKKNLPTVPGFEGSGRIVATGHLLDAKKWLGKRVSCFTQQDKDGSWAEYFYAKPSEVLLIDERLDSAQATTFFVNPFTAWGLCEIALLRESKTIVVNAAGSRLASFLYQLASMHQIEVIGVVRKQSTVEQLKELGWKYVLNENDTDFVNQLKTLALQLHANTAFDAVGGPASGILLNAMPADSENVIYGGLSNKHLADIDPLGMIFDNKMITGFNLIDWMAEADSITLETAQKTITEIMLSGKIKTWIQADFPLAEIKTALKTYLGNMSAGKVILTF